MVDVDFTPIGRVADNYGVDWHSVFRNKETNTALAVGDVLYRDATSDTYKKAVAASTSSDWAVVLKACATTDPTVEVLVEEGVPISLKVGTGATLEPHDFVKVDDDNELVPWVTGTDNLNKCIGQYNQGTVSKISRTNALADATEGQVVYIDFLKRPTQDLIV